MILLCGLPTEAPLALAHAELVKRNVPVLMFNQRHSAGTEISVTVSGQGLRGSLQTNGKHLRLQDVTAVYLRLHDDRRLPGRDGTPMTPRESAHARTLHATLIEWTEITAALVVNRYSRQASNSSKPYQAQLIRACGFAVPETLITNVPDLVRDFHRRHGRIIYKSISGIRSVVTEFSEPDFLRLDRIGWCPVQFQQLVAGTDVRVHVVGDRVFATEIRSSAVDYRYAVRQGQPVPRLAPTLLPEAVAERCVKLARKLELPFAGLDLRIGTDGLVYCFEANPSPAYSYYQQNTGQPIAEALVELLSRAARG